jgi:hypothetical protein
MECAESFLCGSSYSVVLITCMGLVSSSRYLLTALGAEAFKVACFLKPVLEIPAIIHQVVYMKASAYTVVSYPLS